MSKLYLQHDYQVTGRDYVETEGGGDTPAGGISYSTEEVEVGTWIDGSKLYKKTVELENLTSGVDVGVPHGISNIAMVVDGRALFITSDSAFEKSIPIISASSATTQINGQWAAYMGAIGATNCSVTIGSSMLASINHLYATLIYTKTE